MGHRDSIRSWFCHLDVRHMSSTPAPASSSCRCCRLFFEPRIIPVILRSISPHDHCHIITAHSRCAYHNSEDPSYDTLLYLRCCSNVNNKDYIPLTHYGTSTTTRHDAMVRGANYLLRKCGRLCLPTTLCHAPQSSDPNMNEMFHVPG